MKANQRPYGVVISVILAAGLTACGSDKKSASVPQAVTDTGAVSGVLNFASGSTIECVALDGSDSKEGTQEETKEGSEKGPEVGSGESVNLALAPSKKLYLEIDADRVYLKEADAGGNLVPASVTHTVPATRKQKKRVYSAEVFDVIPVSADAESDVLFSAKGKMSSTKTLSWDAEIVLTRDSDEGAIFVTRTTYSRTGEVTGVSRFKKADLMDCKNTAAVL